jgi:hypothetical protein
MNTNFDLSWMDEPIENFPKYHGIYKLLCILLMRRRMTYANLYVLAYAFYKNDYKDNELVLKEKIVRDLATLYLFNNNKLPDGFEFTE